MKKWTLFLMMALLVLSLLPAQAEEQAENTDDSAPIEITAEPSEAEMPSADAVYLPVLDAYVNLGQGQTLDIDAELEEADQARGVYAVLRDEQGNRMDFYVLEKGSPLSQAFTDLSTNEQELLVSDLFFTYDLGHEERARWMISDVRMGRLIYLAITEKDAGGAELSNALYTQIGGQGLLIVFAGENDDTMAAETIQSLTLPLTTLIPPEEPEEPLSDNGEEDPAPREEADAE